MISVNGFCVSENPYSLVIRWQTTTTPIQSHRRTTKVNFRQIYWLLKHPCVFRCYRPSSGTLFNERHGTNISTHIPIRCTLHFKMYATHFITRILAFSVASMCHKSVGPWRGLRASGFRVNQVWGTLR